MTALLSIMGLVQRLRLILGVKAGYLRAFFLFIGLSFTANLQAQNLSGVKKVYTYETFAVRRQPMTYKLYYIIKDSPRNIKGRLYNPLIFSEDSTDIMGYVRYDSIDREMYIVSSNGNGSIITNNIKEEQRFFSFFNDTIHEGGDTTIFYAKNHDSVFVMQTIEDPIPSDVRRVKELIFFRGEFYPHYIIVEDPFFPAENKNVVVVGR